MKRLRNLAAKIGLAALLGASCITGQPKLEEKIEQQTIHQETEERNYRIVFQSDGDGNYEIYIMDADGSEQTNLTNNPNEDISPTPSPDGRKIAYVSYPWQEHSKMEIFVMDSDGKNKRQLTDNNDIDRNPAWAPDSKSLVFLREKELPKNTVYGHDEEGQFHSLAQSGGYIDIHTVDLNRNEKNLTRSVAHNMMPSFSLDGKRITFTSDRDGNYEIYIMDADGNNQVRLTNSGGRDYQPRWSPDGKRILFFSDRIGEREVYVINENGSELDRLTSNSNNDTPTWSPDGKKIAYRQTRDDYSDIWIMNSNGGDKRNVTIGFGNSYSQRWSPDSRTVIFVSSQQTGACSIYSLDLATNKIKELTSSNARNYNPEWIKN